MKTYFVSLPLRICKHADLEGRDKVHVPGRTPKSPSLPEVAYLVNVFAQYLAVRRHYFKTYFILHGSAPRRYALLQPSFFAFSSTSSIVPTM